MSTLKKLYILFVIITIILSCNEKEPKETFETQKIDTVSLKKVVKEEAKSRTLKDIIKEETKDFNDSNDTIKALVHNFYLWYKKAIKCDTMEKTDDLFAIPIIEEGEDGYCIVNQACFKNLRRFKVSERFIENLKEDCDSCEKNIRHILYDSLDFGVALENDCGFNEVNYWIRSQDDYDSFEVGRMKMISNEEYRVLVHLSNLYDYPVQVKVVKEENEWRIDR